MKRGTDAVFSLLLLVATVLYLATIYFVFFRAPIESRMGIVQKIFYFHVPAAYSMYVGAAACFIGSVGYLIRPNDLWDGLGRAGAEIAVTFGAMVLVTGPLWAAKAWGFFWTWDPRLTTALLSVLIYVAYLVLRSFAGEAKASGNSPPRSASSAPPTCPSSTSACRSGAASTPQSSPEKAGACSTPT